MTANKNRPSQKKQERCVLAVNRIMPRGCGEDERTIALEHLQHIILKTVRKEDGCGNRLMIRSNSCAVIVFRYGSAGKRPTVVASALRLASLILRRFKEDCMIAPSGNAKLPGLRMALALGACPLTANFPAPDDLGDALGRALRLSASERIKPDTIALDRSVWDVIMDNPWTFLGEEGKMTGEITGMVLIAPRRRMSYVILKNLAIKDRDKWLKERG